MTPIESLISTCVDAAVDNAEYELKVGKIKVARSWLIKTIEKWIIESGNSDEPQSMNIRELVAGFQDVLEYDIKVDDVMMRLNRLEIKMGV